MKNDRAVMTKGHSIEIGRGRVEVTPAPGGVWVEVSDDSYSQSVLVPDCDRSHVASALRAGKNFETATWATVTVHRGGGNSGTETLWARVALSEVACHFVVLSAATYQTYADMQYPSVNIGPKVAARLAELICPDPLAGAKRRTDDNLRTMFG